MGKHPCSTYCTCEHPCVKPQACRTVASGAGLIRVVLHTRRQKDSIDDAQTRINRGLPNGRRLERAPSMNGCVVLQS